MRTVHTRRNMLAAEIQRRNERALQDKRKR